MATSRKDHLDLLSLLGPPQSTPPPGGPAELSSGGFERLCRTRLSAVQHGNSQSPPASPGGIADPH